MSFYSNLIKVIRYAIVGSVTASMLSLSFSVTAGEKVASASPAMRGEILQARNLDARLNDKYQKARQLLSSSDFRDLRSTQKAWIKFRNRKCKIDTSILKSSDWIKDLSSDRKQLDCASRMAVYRVNLLSELIDSYKEHKYSSNICDSYISAVKHGFDKPWVKMRKVRKIGEKGVSTLTRLEGNKYQVTLDGKNIVLNMVGDEQNQYPSIKYSVAYFSFNKNPRGGLILQSDYTRADPGVSYVFILDKQGYKVITEAGTWGFADIIEFTNKYYFFSHLGEEKISSFGEDGTKSVCHFESPKKDLNKMPPIDCAKGKLCGLISKIPAPAVNYYRSWVNKEFKEQRGINYELFSAGPEELRRIESQSMYWVDLDNDKEEELLVIGENGPPHFPYSVAVFQLNKGKYRELGVGSFGLPKELSPYGDALFVVQENGLFYVVNRVADRSLAKYSAFNVRQTFKVYLTRNGKTTMIEEQTVNYPAILTSK